MTQVKTSKYIGKWIAIVGLAVASGFGLIGVSGLRINHSDSLPLGMWIKEPLTYHRGQIVSVCPIVKSWRKWLSGQKCDWNFKYEPIFKPIAAVAGDKVSVSKEGFSVNGKVLPNSVQFYHDSHGRLTNPYPFGTYIVEPNTVWLISTYNKRSFDSRYFGPIPLTYINSAIRPFLIWKH